MDHVKKKERKTESKASRSRAKVQFDLEPKLLHTALTVKYATGVIQRQADRGRMRILFFGL
jgi:hypothetical protein